MVYFYYTFKIMMLIMDYSYFIANDVLRFKSKIYVTL